MSRLTIRSALTTLALGVSLSALTSTAVLAAPPSDARHASSHNSRHPGEAHYGGREGLSIPGIGPLSKKQLKALNLDEKQQALFNTAQASQREFNQARHAMGSKHHELLKAQLDQGKLDPRALLAAMDADKAQYEPQRAQIRDQWLAVWDSLNADQRGQIATALGARHGKQPSPHDRKGHRDSEAKAVPAEKPGVNSAPN